MEDIEVMKKLVEIGKVRILRLLVERKHSMINRLIQQKGY